MINYLFYFLTSEVFNKGIEDIQSMPDFFSDAISWGQEAAYYAFGFMCILTLAVKFFK